MSCLLPPQHFAVQALSAGLQLQATSMHAPPYLFQQCLTLDFPSDLSKRLAKPKSASFRVSGGWVRLPSIF
jgi:hypothetical protein